MGVVEVDIMIFKKVDRAQWPCRGVLAGRGRQYTHTGYPPIVF